MTDKKWRPTKREEYASYWANWFKDHFPICSAQDYGDMFQSSDRLKYWMEAYWKANRAYFRKHKVSKRDLASAFLNATEKLEIYPYKTRGKEFAKNIISELVKIIIERSKGEILISQEEAEKELAELSYLEYQRSVSSSSEDEKESDIRKLQQKGVSIRAISKRTGIPRSTVHYRLNKAKK